MNPSPVMLVIYINSLNCTMTYNWGLLRMIQRNTDHMCLLLPCSGMPDGEELFACLPFPKFCFSTNKKSSQLQCYKQITVNRTALNLIYCRADKAPKTAVIAELNWFIPIHLHGTAWCLGVGWIFEGQFKSWARHLLVSSVTYMQSPSPLRQELQLHRFFFFSIVPQCDMEHFGKS